MMRGLHDSFGLGVRDVFCERQGAHGDCGHGARECSPCSSAVTQVRVAPADLPAVRCRRVFDAIRRLHVHLRSAVPEETLDFTIDIKVPHALTAVLTLQVRGQVLPEPTRRAAVGPVLPRRPTARVAFDTFATCY